MPLCINTYVCPSTGYSAYELVYLHKPADLTQITYSPLQHMSRSLDDYMKILRKRFDVVKQVVLDKKIHDQSVQKIRQNRIFPRNQTFAVGDFSLPVWSFSSYITDKIKKIPGRLDRTFTD